MTSHTQSLSRSSGRRPTFKYTSLQLDPVLANPDKYATQDYQGPVSIRRGGEDTAFYHSNQTKKSSLPIRSPDIAVRRRSIPPSLSTVTGFHPIIYSWSCLIPMPSILLERRSSSIEPCWMADNPSKDCLYCQCIFIADSLQTSTQNLKESRSTNTKMGIGLDVSFVTVDNKWPGKCHDDGAMMIH
ncbi:hypothetical protein T4B_9370 [Trichinella pseudospiralis]|uniref:Uncharacterized protein n=1 Tax=Trichinella pseudospiralis TaxID=6337 RepID=A0A0V1JD32_TRIPS|nr:hypothetical protein T4B_9370 [Trichinella pseudospiralis]KRZ46377.1 hypothetical protein T4C_10517 [Trichinella pseudospiralis]